MKIRYYEPADYEQLKALYLDSSLFGGQFDDARDSEIRLHKKIEADPNSILVAEEEGRLIGTVSLIDDGRVAWLFRFAVTNMEVAKLLHDKAIDALKQSGHSQVLVYSPVSNQKLNSRYDVLGFTKGGDYSCFWKDI